MNLDFFKVLVSVVFVFCGATSLAQSFEHGFTEEQIAEMVEANAKLAKKEAHEMKLSSTKPKRIEEGYFVPFVEYESQGFLIFNDLLNFNSREAKRRFLEFLPDHVTPVIFTSNASPEYQQSLIETYGPYMKYPEKLQIMYTSDRDNGFWARDGIPVPGYYHRPNGTKDFMVVDAKYYHRFEPDAEVAEYFGASIWGHDYYFEGGNFIVNSKAHCLVVDNSRVRRIPDSVFSKYYGCKKLVRLPHTRGIGHADESVKFLSDDLVITDLKDYEVLLKRKGYRVVLMPRAKGSYETYINSVILGDTVYMPAYGNDLDNKAANAYRLLGYKAVPMNSYELSNYGKGSLHCISMVYPNLD